MYPATVPLRWLDGFVGLWCGGTILIGVRVLGELIDGRSSLELGFDSAVVTTQHLGDQISTALLIFLQKKKIFKPPSADVTRAEEGEPAK